MSLAEPSGLYMVEREHSPLGPSSLARVESCVPSALLVDQVPAESQGSTMDPYAREGTIAHMLFEACLKTGTEPFDWYGEPIIEAGEEVETIDTEMIDHLSPMVHWVREEFTEFEVERKLQHPEYEEIYGYTDVTGKARAPVLDAVADLKYGMRFVAASSVQMVGYGLMHIWEKDEIDLKTLRPDTEVLRTTVLQPRLDNPVRHHIWTAGALLAEAKRIGLIRKRYVNREMVYNAGAHCTDCRISGVCPKLRATVKSVVLASDGEPLTPEAIAEGLITPEDIDNAAGILRIVNTWTKAARASVDRYLLGGGTLQNAKLVHKKAARAFDPKKEAAVLALAKSCDVDPYTERELLSPPQLEKKLPKIAKPKIAGLLDKGRKPQITTALADDPRPAVKTGAAFLAAQAGKKALDAKKKRE